MDKRQETFNTLSIISAWLTLSLFIIATMAACQTSPTSIPALPNQPAYTPNTESPSGGSARTATPTAPTPPRVTPSTTPTISCLEQGGEIHSEAFYSQNLAGDFHFLVYLPPCYQVNSDQRYPVTYLLHGLSFNEDQWIRLGLAELMDHMIAAGTLPPFIVILPGEVRFQPPQTSGFADALVLELIPLIDKEYRTLPEKAFRAIGGLSRGAAWSVHIGFEYYQLFSSVGAHSLPLFEADGNRLKTWLAQIPFDDLPSVFIDIGRADPERLSAQDFADQLNENNVPHTWYLFNGSHTEDYWSTHLELYLRWYGRDW